jgi:hypothetical protein
LTPGNDSVGSLARATTHNATSARAKIALFAIMLIEEKLIKCDVAVMEPFSFQGFQSPKKGGTSSCPQQVSSLLNAIS